MSPPQELLLLGFVQRQLTLVTVIADVFPLSEQAKTFPSPRVSVNSSANEVTVDVRRSSVKVIFIKSSFE